PLSIFASSGGFVGDGELQRAVLMRKPWNLRHGIEGSLLIFPAVIEDGPAVLDHLAKNQLHGLLSQRRIAVRSRMSSPPNAHLLFPGQRHSSASPAGCGWRR